jgi:hypothetical protein
MVPATMLTIFAYAVGTAAIAVVKKTSTNTAKNANAKIPNSRRKKRKALAANARANARNQFSRAINTATTTTIIVDVTGMAEIVVVTKITTIIVIKQRVANAWTVNSNHKATSVLRDSRRSAEISSGKVTRTVTMRTTTLAVLGMVAIAAVTRISTITVKSANAWTVPKAPAATNVSKARRKPVAQKITLATSTATTTITMQVATGTRVTAVVPQTTTNIAKTASAVTAHTCQRVISAPKV